MILNHYPEPVRQRYSTFSIAVELTNRPALWKVTLPNGDVWWLNAIDRSAAIKQGRQLWELTQQGAIGSQER